MPASTPRTRLIFQNVSLLTGPAALSGLTATGAMSSVGNGGNNLIMPLANVQSANVSIDISQQDVNTFGKLNRRGTVQLNPANIQLGFTYFPVDGYNEKMLGMNIGGGSFISGILTKVSDSKNYFLAISQQGVDDLTVTNMAQRDILAVGNGYISNYSLEAAVGQIPTVNVSVDGMNLVGITGSSGFQTPAINPETSARISAWTAWLPTGEAMVPSTTIALRPGDIRLEFPTEAGFLVPLSGANAVNVQSVSVSIPIGRENINKLGSQFGFSREIQFPVNCQLQIRALQTDLQTGSYDSLACGDPEYSFKIRLRKPACPGVTSEDGMIIGFNNAKVTNVSFGNTIGGNSTVDISATSQLAGAFSTAGITLSGSYGG